MLETLDFVHGSAMWSLSFVISECFLSGRGQDNVSNFCNVNLENFVTASRRYTGDIHNLFSVGSLWHLQDNGSDSIASWLSAHVYYTLPTVTLQLHTICLVRTCRTSSFCIVAWQLARFQLTRRIARSLCDSWAFYFCQLEHPKSLQ